MFRSFFFSSALHAITSNGFCCCWLCILHLPRSSLFSFAKFFFPSPRRYLFSSSFLCPVCNAFVLCCRYFPFTTAFYSKVYVRMRKILNEKWLKLPTRQGRAPFCYICIYSTMFVLIFFLLLFLLIIIIIIRCFVLVNKLNRPSCPSNARKHMPMHIGQDIHIVYIYSLYYY